MEMLIIFWIICGALGAVVTDRKALGFTLGILLGPLGVIAAAVLKKAPVPKPSIYSDDVVFGSFHKDIRKD